MLDLKNLKKMNNEEILDVLKIVEKTPESIAEKIAKLHAYFNYDFNWNGKYVSVTHIIIYDNNDTINNYKQVVEEHFQCFELLYSINLKLHRINGDSYYDIKRNFSNFDKN